MSHVRCHWMEFEVPGHSYMLDIEICFHLAHDDAANDTKGHQEPAQMMHKHARLLAGIAHRGFVIPAQLKKKKLSCCYAFQSSPSISFSLPPTSYLTGQVSYKQEQAAVLLV